MTDLNWYKRGMTKKCHCWRGPYRAKHFEMHCIDISQRLHPVEYAIVLLYDNVFAMLQYNTVYSKCSLSFFLCKKFLSAAAIVSPVYFILDSTAFRKLTTGFSLKYFVNIMLNCLWWKRFCIWWACTVCFIVDAVLHCSQCLY